MGWNVVTSMFDAEARNHGYASMPVHADRYRRAEELVEAVKDGDQLRLVSIPGVGKKLAERMIVELRDKFTTLQSRPSEAIPQNNDSQLVQDAVSALVNLGYRKAEVEKNVRDMIQTGKRTLEEVIKDVLRRMSR